MNKIILATLASALLLGGCASMSATEKKQAQTLVIAKCPVIKKYTKAQLQKAAAELKSLPSDSQVAELVTDYGKIRDACRVITKKLKQQNG